MYCSYKYSIKTLQAINENYNSFCPAHLPFTRAWASLIEAKVDYDRSLKTLTWQEKKIIESDFSLDVDKRRVFRKMVRYLNGEKWE